jgi:hypothetical protein
MLIPYHQLRICGHLRVGHSKVVVHIALQKHKKLAKLSTVTVGVYPNGFFSLSIAPISIRP